MSREFITALQDRRAALKTELGEILTAPTSEKRDLNDDERARFDAKEAEVRQIDARITELDEQLQRDEQAAATAKRYAPTGVTVTSEPKTYERGNGHSYFLDLMRSTVGQGDGDGGVTAARTRLDRHRAELDVEMPKRERQRAARAERELRGVDEASTFERRVNPNRVDGQGGYFVPPLWLVDEYIDLPRFGRTIANSVRNMTLPSGTDSINVPKVATGTAVGVQTADAAAVTSQDLTDTFVSAPVRTIAGQQDIAIQLLDQSPASFDEIVIHDLHADYNQKLDIQVANGSGVSGQLKGILNVSGINAVTYTDASPTLPKMYPFLMQALSQSAKNRKMMPNAVFLTPSRWFWMASQLDGQSRPLILPDTSAPWNPLALQTGGDGVEGPVGRILNFPLLADGNIPSNLGAGSNEERIIIARTSDMYLWEGAMRTRVLPEILSGTLQVRLQIYNYAAFMPDRRPEQISVISGTGVIAPTGY
ncbi:phage major capsid protein [Kitasatospora sp. NPDC056076]|uniref:phage major capsid protein n=1 Tax=Kitasatospora sp. NPDC056076 TaxID=3345703 RepID=UPI0035E0E92F